MSLPSSPTNGQVATLGNRSFVYTTATNQWLGAGSTTLANVNLNDLGGILAATKGGFGVDVSFDTGDPQAARSLINAPSTTDVSAAEARLFTLEQPRAYRVLNNVATGFWQIRDDDHGKVIFIDVPTAKTLDIQIQASVFGMENSYRVGIEVGIHVYGAGVITLAWPATVFVDGVVGPSTKVLVRHAQAMVSRNPAINLWNFGGLTA